MKKVGVKVVGLYSKCCLFEGIRKHRDGKILTGGDLFVEVIHEVLSLIEVRPKCRSVSEFQCVNREHRLSLGRIMLTSNDESTSLLD